MAKSQRSNKGTSRDEGFKQTGQPDKLHITKDSLVTVWHYEDGEAQVETMALGSFQKRLPPNKSSEVRRNLKDVSLEDLEETLQFLEGSAFGPLYDEINEEILKRTGRQT